jgi:hypothetical protein
MLFEIDVEVMQMCVVTFVETEEFLLYCHIYEHGVNRIIGYDGLMRLMINAIKD